MNIFSVPHDGPFQSHLCFYCFLVCIDFYSNKHLCKQYFHAVFNFEWYTHATSCIASEFGWQSFENVTFIAKFGRTCKAHP